LLSEEGVASGRIVATPDAVVGERFAATEEGAVYEAGGVAIEKDE
jgi:hypothetical protein